MADPANAAPPAHCPICSRPATSRFKPFCSLRCADADLGKWFTGAYRVPGPPAEETSPNASKSPSGILDQGDDPD